MEPSSRKVKLTIVSGEALPSMDSNGLADPFVKIMVEEGDSMKLKKIGKTKVQKNTLNPQWNEEFELELTTPEIYLELWDYDFLKKDEALGLGKIILKNVLPDTNTAVSIFNSKNPTDHPIIYIRLTGHEHGWHPIAEDPNCDEEFRWRDYLHIHKDHMRFHEKLRQIELVGVGPQKPRIHIGFECIQSHEDLKNHLPHSQRPFLQSHFDTEFSPASPAPFRLGDRDGCMFQKWDYYTGTLQAICVMLLDTQPNAPSMILRAELLYDDTKSIQNDIDVLPLWSGFISFLTKIPHWTELPGSVEDFEDYNYRVSLPPYHNSLSRKDGISMSFPFTDDEDGPQLKMSFIDAPPDADTLEWKKFRMHRLKHKHAEIAIKEELKVPKKKNDHSTEIVPNKKTWFLRLASGSVLRAQLYWHVGYGLKFAEFMVPQILSNISHSEETDDPVPDPVWNFECMQTV